jgi:hypothetical protein
VYQYQSIAEDETLNQGDPTDHALAAIASILDHPAEKPPSAVDLPAEATHAVEEPEAPRASTVVKSASSGLDGYSKAGPGPLDAIRFRWTARSHSDGSYYVDETIGANSHPISSGPMPADSVVAFIDAREQEARQRFEKLRSDMTSIPILHPERDETRES